MASGGGPSDAEALTHFGGERESLAGVGRQSEYDRPKSALYLVCILHSNCMSSAARSASFRSASRWISVAERGW